MRSITDFINEATKDFGDELEGNPTMGGFDGPPLAETREYRVKVARAEWRQATGSGKWSYSITFEVVDDPAGEFVGRKFSEYYNIDADAHEASKRAFARFIGESGVNLADVDDSSNESFIEAFEDVTFIAATRTWGTEGDRTGIRYLNRDRGQNPRASITPKKARGASAKPLTADITVAKQVAEEEPFPPAEEPAAEPVELPGSDRKVADVVNLPPGLQK